MQKITQFITDMVKAQGYEAADVLVSGEAKNKDGGSISLITVDSIRYPIDKMFIRDHLIHDGNTYGILTDGSSVHIFSVTGDEVQELSGLPQKGPSVIDEESLMVERTSQFSDLRNLISMHLYDREGAEDLFRSMVLIAYAADREKVWFDLEDKVSGADVWDMCVQKASEQFPYFSKILGSMEGKENFDTFGSALLKFKRFNISKPSPSLSKSFVDSRSFRTYEPHINSVVNNSVIDNSRGDLAILSVDAASALADLAFRNRDGDVYGNLDSDYSIALVLSGKDWVDPARIWNMDGMYDTIVVIPPFGARNMFPTTSISVTESSECSVLRAALPHLKDGGRLIAIVPAGFLFSKSCAKLRNELAIRYHVSGLFKIEGLLRPQASIDTCLLVIDDDAGRDCIVSRQPLTVADLPNLKGVFESIRPDPDLFAIVSNKFFDDSWMPNQLISKQYPAPGYESAKKLSEVCEIFSGCRVMSSEYFPDGSFAGIPYLRISDISDDKVILDKAVRIPSDRGKVFSQAGDIAFSINGVIGKMGVAGDRVFVPAAQVVLLRPKEGFDTQTILQSLKSKFFRDQLDTIVKGSVIKSVSVRELSSLRVDL